MCNCKQPIKILFAKDNDSVIIPCKIDEDAGYDIYANFEEESIIIQPNETIMIPTGLASALPTTHYFQLFERGSTGTKGMGQRCGVIDSGFRHFWFVPITNHNNIPIIITKNPKELIEKYAYGTAIIYPYKKAICQAVLIEVPQTDIEVVSYDDLLKIDSNRGLGMLGESGK